MSRLRSFLLWSWTNLGYLSLVIASWKHSSYIEADCCRNRLNGLDIEFVFKTKNGGKKSKLHWYFRQRVVWWRHSLILIVRGCRSSHIWNQSAPRLRHHRGSPSLFRCRIEWATLKSVACSALRNFERISCKRWPSRWHMSWTRRNFWRELNWRMHVRQLDQLYGDVKLARS